MFTQNTITVAARCAECCSEIQTEISVFNLSGGKIKAVCPNCGKSTLEITLSPDGKVRLSVPCVACPHPHPFTLSAEAMFTKELFILQCSFTRLDICFMGAKNRVKEELIKNGKELQAMMAETSLEEGELDETLIEQMRVILTFIEECAQKGDILCRCRNMKTAPGVEMQLGEDSVTLTCRDCGRSIVFFADDFDFTEKLMDLGKIPLDDMDD